MTGVCPGRYTRGLGRHTSGLFACDDGLCDTLVVVGHQPCSRATSAVRSGFHGRARNTPRREAEGARDPAVSTSAGAATARPADPLAYSRAAGGGRGPLVASLGRRPPPGRRPPTPPQAVRDRTGRHRRHADRPQRARHGDAARDRHGARRRSTASCMTVGFTEGQMVQQGRLPGADRSAPLSGRAGAGAGHAGARPGACWRRRRPTWRATRQLIEQD